jgi:phosphate starvation-inducible PhoH-like protein
MSDKLITLSNIELAKLFGTNNHKLDKIKTLFPQIKIVARGEQIKLIGARKQIMYFEKKLVGFIKHLEQYNSLTISQI